MNGTSPTSGPPRPGPWRREQPDVVQHFPVRRSDRQRHPTQHELLVTGTGTSTTTVYLTIAYASTSGCTGTTTIASTTGVALSNGSNQTTATFTPGAAGACQPL